MKLVQTCVSVQHNFCLTERQTLLAVRLRFYAVLCLSDPILLVCVWSRFRKAVRDYGVFVVEVSRNHSAAQAETS
jgi:hypothetical protein